MAIHQIVVWIHKLDTSFHKGDALDTWVPEENNWQRYWWYLFPAGRPPTFFWHPWYRDLDQYPDGTANCVGYWAEARILGGVVLFDQYNSEVLPHVHVEGSSN